MKYLPKNMTHKEYVMTAGAIVGIVLSFSTMVSYYTGSLFTAAADYIVAVILFLSIGLTMHLHRNVKKDSSFVNHLQTGASTSFWAAVILAFTYFVLINYVDKGLVKEYLAFIETELVRSTMKIDNTKEFLEQLRSVTTPNMIAFQKFLGKLMLGIFFSAIFALLLSFKFTDKKSF
jgi:hypothetical protein